MSRSARFLFDTDFAAAAAEEQRKRAKPPPPPPPRFSQEELEAARTAAFAEGRAKGIAEAEAAGEHAAAAALESVAREIGRVAEAVRGERPAEAHAALALAAAIARKFAPHLARTAPMAAIERFIAGQLAELVEEPRVVVRLAEHIADLLAEQLGELGRSVGFPGDIVVLGDSAVEPGDCRIEWADGGVERRLARKLEEIDALIESFFEAPAEESRGEEPSAPPRPDNEPSAEE